MGKTRNKIKEIIYNNKALKNILYFFNRNQIQKGIEFQSFGQLKRNKIIQQKNSFNNLVSVGKGSSVWNNSIEFRGSNNKVIIDEDVLLIGNTITLYDDNNVIHISKNAELTRDHLVVLEGGKIVIGEHCLFSYEIVVRNSDAHSILDLDGNRVNPARDVIIGKHVWVGQRAMILKGACIGDDCVIGAYSLITRGNYPKNSIIVGQPGKVLKSNINWTATRIK